MGIIRNRICVWTYNLAEIIDSLCDIRLAAVLENSQRGASRPLEAALRGPVPASSGIVESN